MDELLATLNALSTYLNKPTHSHREELEVYQSVYDNNWALLHHDFYTCTIDKLPDVINLQIADILNSLHVPLEKQGRYLNQPITLFDFLVEVHDLIPAPDELDAHDPLGDYIARIKEQNATRWGRIILWSVFLSACSVVPFFVYGLTAIEQFLTTTAVVSAAGLGYTLAMGIYTFYQYQDPEENPQQDISYYRMFRDNFFALANTLVLSVAWSLMLTAAASTPVISVLFVVGEFMFVAKELVSLGFIYLFDKPGIEPGANLIDQQKQAREISNFKTRRHEVWVNLAAAIFLTVIIAAWCFIPGGFILAAVCSLAIVAVHLTKKYAADQNKQRMQDLLCSEFDALESNHEVRESLEPNDELLHDAALSESSSKAPSPAPSADRAVSPVDRVVRLSDESLVSKVGIFKPVSFKGKDDTGMNEPRNTYK